MNNRTLEILEFGRVYAMLESECFSEEGKDLLGKQKFITSGERLLEFQEIVADVKKFLDSDLVFPVVSFPRISDYMMRAEKSGAVLEGDELVSIADFILSSVKLKKYFLSGSISTGEVFRRIVSEIPDLHGTADKITSVLDPSGKVKDSHPALRDLRNRLRKLRGDISRLASSYLVSSRDVWQSDTPAERDGRIVLPLKADYRGRIKGVIHDISSKGATVYIEPFDLVELNNRAAVAENEIVVQIRKILKDLTASAAESAGEIMDLADKISFIDTITARARFSLMNGCSRADTGGRGILLKKARHPLLGRKAVPIDISISGDLNALIITGPNAGGKTVTLKTIGLLSLMNQFGMDIPAAEGSTLPVFDSIFADVGDDQSLDNSMSTFSAHMEHIAEMIRKSSDRSLILLDELGSGTDPAEGVSIAMAVLDEFIAKNSLVITTSHHGLLKNYGYTREHVDNASMEFDSESHTPTYRVIQGIPGESHAIEIAERSGLPSSVIKRAVSYMHSGSSDVGEMIKELEKKHRILTEREKKLKEDIKKYDLEVLRLRQREKIAADQGYDSLKKYLSESRKKLENLVRELREGEITRKKTTAVKKFLSDIENRLEAEAEKTSDSGDSNGKDISGYGLKEGQNVLVGKFKRPGVVVRKEKDGRWLVLAGNVKMSLSPDDIFPADTDKSEKNYSVSVSGVLSGNRPSFTLDIRGLRAEEASLKVTKQLDNAIMSGMREFEIIHGKGGGALQKVVRDILKESDAVESFEFARPEAGGFGKTIVRLKD